MKYNELEEAFNETTDSAVDLLKENVELKKEVERLNHEADTYMKIAIARQKRIDKAIELCEEQFIDYEVNYLGKKNKRYAVINAGKIIEILKGE